MKLAYINKTTLDILQNLASEEIDDYFECDEDIAPIVALLNKKGYKTRHCCQGHLYDNLSICKVSLQDDPESSETEKDMENRIFGYVSHTERKDGWLDVVTRKSEMHGYITFETYVKFGELLNSFPEENICAYSCNNGIYWDFIDGEDMDFKTERSKEIEVQKEPYIFFKNRINALSAIYEWVKALPEYEDIMKDEDRKNKEFLEVDVPKIKALYKDLYKDKEDFKEFDTVLDALIWNVSLGKTGEEYSEGYIRMLGMDFEGRKKVILEMVDKMCQMAVERSKDVPQE